MPTLSIETKIPLLNRSCLSPVLHQFPVLFNRKQRSEPQKMEDVVLVLIRTGGVLPMVCYQTKLEFCQKRVACGHCATGDEELRLSSGISELKQV